MKNRLLLLVGFLSFLPSALAEPHPDKILTSPKCQCKVKDKEGETSDIFIIRNDVEIFHVDAVDVTTTFSPSGKYIAFTGSDQGNISFDDAKYKLLVFNCITKNVKGFGRIDAPSKIKSTVLGEIFYADLKWDLNETRIDLNETWIKSDRKHIKPTAILFSKDKLP